MGLVGSLEDLGLGDILQIVSLARKSGILSLKWQDVRGKIIFRDGLVVAALSSEIKHDLGMLLAERAMITPEQWEESLSTLSQEGIAGNLKDVLTSSNRLSVSDIDEVIKEKIEEVAFSFFSWPEGNFSFELTEVEPEIRKLKRPWRDFILNKGLSPQYLAMEGTRQHDERRRKEEESPVGPVSPRSPDEAATSATREAVSLEEDFSSVSDFIEAAESKPHAETAEEPEIPTQEEKPLPSPEIAPTGPCIMIVDDDPLLLKSLDHHLRPKGYQVYTFSSLSDAQKQWQKLKHTDRSFAILADLIMPSSDETNILGGLEFLEKVRAVDASIPFLLMTDYENQLAEKQARKLGANYFFYKPKSSQLDEDYSSPELLNFVAVLENAVAVLPEPARESPKPEAKQEGMFNLAEELSRELGDEGFGLTMPQEETPSRGLSMLKAMINELNDPSSSGQITLLVLRFASEMMNRAVIFLVARNQLAGLGQFGIDLDGKDPELHVRRIRIPLNEPSIFQETLQKRMPLKKQLKHNKWNDYLIQNLGGIEPAEVFVAPIISSGRIAAILYGDNVPEQKEIGDTESLEIFLAQAGLAMEKALLERRLSELKGGK
jgi:CheY-like chemotaxis protein